MLSKRSDTYLEAIARGTGGTIVKLGLASSDLGTLYESKIEPLGEAARGLATRRQGRAISALSALGLGVFASWLFAGQPRLALALALALALEALELAKPRLASLHPSPWPAVLVGLAVLAAAGGDGRPRLLWSRRSQQWSGESKLTMIAGSTRRSGI